MKWIKMLVPAALILLLFSGCSFRLASSVDELISPVSPSGDNANIQNALDSFCKGGFSLRTPAGGEYTTSYIFYDFDSDGSDEAVVFYEPSSNPGIINMALIDKKGGDWSVIYNIEGNGSDVYSINFSDLNGDKTPEFIVLWDIISNSQSHVLSVYEIRSSSSEFSLSEANKTITMNDYITVDIDTNGEEELMVFTVDSGDSISANAVLYSYSEGNLKSLGSTKLDGHISSYKNLISENIDGTVYVYADAVKSNGVQMLTEIIHWSDYYDTIISPFYSYSTGITKRTTRSVMMTCRDINSDGYIELPLDADMTELPAQVAAINWKQFNNSVLDHICYSVAVEKDGYQIVIPDDYFERISVSYDSEKSEMTVSDTDGKEIFSVLSLLKTRYDEASESYSGFTEIMNDSGYIYLAAAGSDSDIKITTEELKNMIKPYEGE